MFLIVKDSKIVPNDDMLFWAMNWEDSRRHEFYDLLKQFVDNEYIEYNRNDETYSFPEFGTTPLSKLIEDEKLELNEKPLSFFVEVWNEIYSLRDIYTREYNDKIGSNRYFKPTIVSHPDDIVVSNNKLKDFYSRGTNYEGNGKIIYFIVSSENKALEFKNLIPTDISKYIVYAIPENYYQFEKLIEATKYYKAIENCFDNPETINKPIKRDRLQNLKTQSYLTLENYIKDTFASSNWKWNYEGEIDKDISNNSKLNKWINEIVESLFHASPIIKDEALIYTTRGQKDRKKSISVILTSEKDSIPTEGTSADQRILNNFFRYTELYEVRKRGKRNIQLGEIKMPPVKTKIFKVWNLINVTLDDVNYCMPDEIFNELYNEPYGYSPNVVKLFLACYFRYHSDRVFVYYNDKSPTKTAIPIDESIIEKLVDKPSQFLIRKINISSSEMFYITKLRTIIDIKEIGFLGLLNGLLLKFKENSTVHNQLISTCPDQGMKNFYQCLCQYSDELATGKSNPEELAKVFFLDELPGILVDINSREELLDNRDNVIKLTDLLSKYLSAPEDLVEDFKYEVIKSISSQVFSVDIDHIDDLNKVVLGWYKNLPEPNKNNPHYSKDKINMWLKHIKYKTSEETDHFYLDILSDKPIHDWETPIDEKYKLISQIKDYKKEIEEYKIDAIERLRRIAIEVFESSPNDCSSEKVFDIMFKEKWQEISPINKSHSISKETDIIEDYYDKSIGIKTKYLEIIPKEWKSIGFLPQDIPDEWENWTNADTMKVAECYKSTFTILEEWKPPIEPQELISSIGNIFDKNAEITGFDNLYTLIIDWTSSLPERTQEANKEDISVDVNYFYFVISEKDKFRNRLMNTLEETWKFNDMLNWKKSTLDKIVVKIQGIKKQIEDWRRPLIQVVHLLEQEDSLKSDSEWQFVDNTRIIVEESAAYKNNVPEDVIGDINAAFLINSVRDRLKFKEFIEKFSELLKINPDWHLWTDKEEQMIFHAYKNGLEAIIKWKEKKEDIVKKAVDKIMPQIVSVKKEYNLSDYQIRVVINKILEKIFSNKS